MIIVILLKPRDYGCNSYPNYNAGLAPILYTGKNWPLFGDRTSIAFNSTNTKPDVTNTSKAFCYQVSVNGVVKAPWR